MKKFKMTKMTIFICSRFNLLPWQNILSSRQIAAGRHRRNISQSRRSPSCLPSCLPSYLPLFIKQMETMPWSYQQLAI